MNLKKIFIIFFILLFIFGVSIRIFSINKDYSAEEVDFVKASAAIKETGHPIFYHSEQKPVDLALYHPPMYIFLVSLSMMIIKGEVGVRIVNLVFSFLTSIFIFLFCSQIIKNEKGKIIGLVSSALFLINYYAFSSSVLIDIDMLSCFFVFGFIFFILKSYQTNKKTFSFLAGLFLFFSIANRFIIAGIVYIGIGIYYLINKELRKDFKKYFLIGFFACLFFFIVWFVYSQFIEHISIFYFIQHNIMLGEAQFSSFLVYAGSFILNISQIIRLLTFPVIFLGILSIAYFLKQRKKQRLSGKALPRRY